MSMSFLINVTKDDLKIFRIAMFGGMVFGALLTVTIPGSQKLTFIQFQIMCTILLFLSLLFKSKKIV